MSRINERLKKLEGKSTTSESLPRCIIVRGLVADGEDEPELYKLSGHGMTFDRLPGEDEEAFIDRANKCIRLETQTSGPVLLCGLSGHN